jgi:hypothetical protein
MTIINDHTTSPRAEGRPFGAQWVLTVPWAHPLWSQYWVALYDLTTKHADGTVPMIARPGMTHEMILWAINPDKPVTVWESRPDGCLLTPPNHGYQFKAESDEEAEARIAKISLAIEERGISPDTDWRGVWNELFIDGVSLHYSALERAAATVQ